MPLAWPVLTASVCNLPVSGPPVEILGFESNRTVGDCKPMKKLASFLGGAYINRC